MPAGWARISTPGSGASGSSSLRVALPPTNRAAKVSWKLKATAPKTASKRRSISVLSCDARVSRSARAAARSPSCPAIVERRASSRAYSSSASGVYLSTELFQRLGIADQIMQKSHRIEAHTVLGNHDAIAPYAL